MECKRCEKTEKYFEILPSNVVNPITCEISELRKLFAFFHYESPNTSSYISSYIPQEMHDELLKEMLSKWKKERCIFISNNETIDKFLEPLYLSDIKLCSYCKRFVCKRNRKDSKTGYKETDFECLLRHIRNAIAHARVFVIHRGNNISLLFEDRYKQDKITARIICNQADLKRWRDLINKKGKE